MNVHVITGGGSGIGFECAKRFKDGIVLITGRNEKKLNNAVEELKTFGVTAKYHISDVSSRESMKELAEFAKDIGTIKTVINSAGVSGDGTTAEITFKIDLLGSEYIIDEFYNVIEDNSVVIMISSMMGKTIPDNPAYDDLLREPSKEGNLEKLVAIVEDKSNVAYNFAKKGVVSLVLKNADRFGSKGSRILAVSPGIIMTKMAEVAEKEHPEQMKYLRDITPMGRLGSIEDIANTVEFLCSDKASFITGSNIFVDGGLANNLDKLAQI